MPVRSTNSRTGMLMVANRGTEPEVCALCTGVVVVDSASICALMLSHAMTGIEMGCRCDSDGFVKGIKCYGGRFVLNGDITIEFLVLLLMVELLV